MVWEPKKSVPQNTRFGNLPGTEITVTAKYRGLGYQILLGSLDDKISITARTTQERLKLFYGTTLFFQEIFDCTRKKC